MPSDVLLDRWLFSVLAWGLAALAGAVLFVVVARRLAEVPNDAPWYEAARLSVSWRVAGGGLMVFAAAIGAVVAMVWARGAPLGPTARLAMYLVALVPAHLAMRLVPGRPTDSSRTLAQRARAFVYYATRVYSRLWALVVPAILCAWLPSTLALEASAVVIVALALWQVVALHVPRDTRPSIEWTRTLAHVAAAAGVAAPAGGVLPIALPTPFVLGPHRIDASEGLLALCDGDPKALEGAAWLGLAWSANMRVHAASNVVQTLALGVAGTSAALAQLTSVGAGTLTASTMLIVIVLVVAGRGRTQRLSRDLLAREPVTVGRLMLRLLEHRRFPLVPVENSGSLCVYDVLANAGEALPFPRPAPPVRTRAPMVVMLVALVLAVGLWTAIVRLAIGSEPAQRGPMSIGVTRA